VNLGKEVKSSGGSGKAKGPEQRGQNLSHANFGRKKRLHKKKVILGEGGGKTWDKKKHHEGLKGASRGSIIASAFRGLQ